MSLNPLNNFSISGGVDSLKEKFTNPLAGYLSADQRKADLKHAHERQDFKEGLILTPFDRSGSKIDANIVRLMSDAMPHDSLSFGGTQKIAKDYYPGNSEPTVQVLGPQESDITIKGRFKAKRLKQTAKDFDQEKWRKYPVYLQEQVDRIRLNGFLVHIQMGAWHRWGFIQECQFQMKTLADIDYSITFLITGFNRPKGYILVDPPQAIPYATSKALSEQLLKMQTKAIITPAAMPKSFADQITGAISDVAAAANLVTGFVDTVLAEVNSLKASVQRALGLIKNCRNKITQYQRTIGGKNPEGDVNKSTRINGAVANASYVAAVSANMNVMNSYLAQLASQLKAVTATVPLARHRIQSGDTLQTIAAHYYNDSSLWELIYDHNKLTSSILTVGAILEIPRH